MKKFKVLGDLSNVIRALDKIEQDEQKKAGVNKILSTHLMVMKHQQKELNNLTEELLAVKTHNRNKKVKT